MSDIKKLFLETVLPHYQNHLAGPKVTQLRGYDDNRSVAQ